MVHQQSSITQGILFNSITPQSLCQTSLTCLRSVDTFSLQTATWAGHCQKSGSIDGDRASAQFNHPTGLTIVNGTSMYICDAWNKAIRVIDLRDDTVTTLTTLSEAPVDLTVHPVGEFLLVITETNLLIAAMNNGTVYTMSSGSPHRSGIYQTIIHSLLCFI